MWFGEDILYIIYTGKECGWLIKSRVKLASKSRFQSIFEALDIRRYNILFASAAAALLGMAVDGPNWSAPHEAQRKNDLHAGGA
jgi:hypothetical protein